MINPYKKEFNSPIYFTENWIDCPIIFEKWLYVNINGVVPNYYLISNLGILKNIKGQIIKPQLINSGYLVYKLYTGDGSSYITKYKTILAHRLVMLTFHPIKNPELYTVNHEDLDPFNNTDYNLSWMLQYDNNIHKQNNLLLDGTRNYHALFNFDQLRIIKECLDNNICYKDILNKLDIPDSKVNRDYIGNIKRGITYKREMELLSK